MLNQIVEMFFDDMMEVLAAKKGRSMAITDLNHRLGPDEFEAYTKILMITLWKGSYPHEILCCMFNKCLSEWAEDTDEKTQLDEPKIIDWTPRRIVRELSDTSLSKLCTTLEKDYISLSALPEELVSACFRLLYRQMNIKVGEIIKPSDHNAQERWSRILNRLVGETKLCDYFGGNPEDNISDWSHRVLRTVRQFMVEEDWLERPLEELLEIIVTS
jgi:hypothetical protein